uniref:Alpha/beta hydrolase fold-3 domain-containing protein n=1 Tax=Salix viminalis TaxID=40686 RepID=A0A6N2N456_SALVM
MSQNSADLPWKVRLFASLFSSAFKFMIRRTDGSINRRLLNFLDYKTSPSPNKPVDGVITTDFTIDEARNLWFRVYTPVPTSGSEVNVPVIFYFHGSGFICMAASSKLFDGFCYRLARLLPAVIVSVNYRLAPENRYPCQYEDGFDAIRFVDKSYLEILPSHANLKHSFVAGDSAGGNLAHHMAVKASKSELSSIKLTGVIAIQPFFGGEERTRSEIKLSRRSLCSDGYDRLDVEIVSAGGFKSRPSSLKLPAVLVIVGGLDPLQDWQKRYYEGLKKSGKEVYLVDYVNAFHSFYLFPCLPEFPLFIEHVKEFMQEQMST